MEKDFNPIRDLRSPEVDPFNVPAGQSTQEIEAIRLTLVVTREKTENLVKLLKRKGLIFKQDVEKIKELQRRLRKTIPRIPILRDDSITGTETSIDDSRRSRFDVMRGFRKPPKTPTTTSVPVANPFPFFEVAAAIASVTNIKGIKMPKFIKNLFGKGKTTDTADDMIKIINDLIKKEKAKVKVDKKKLEELERVLASLTRKPSVTAGKVDTPIKTTFSRDFNNKGNIKITKKLAKNSLKTEQIADDIIVDLGNRTTDLKGEFELIDNVVDSLNNSIKKGESVANVKLMGDATFGSLSTIRLQVEEALKLAKPNSVNAKNLKLLLRKIDDGVEKANKVFQPWVKENNLIGGPELLKDFKPKDGAFLNIKPMSNDIAMLNTDTRDRETIVIITDSIA